ncbi:uncharacterized protein TNCV_958151 [Trichonephila clavipes]|nr:uncharacterized protein TNCV_958151 [Trichonephila clavipes]
MFSEKSICGRVPKISSPAELNRRWIVLSDLENEDSEIDILIGANVAGLLFMDGCIELQSDRFRRYPIELSADIEKAFLQLGITPKHRDFLRFFYPGEGQEIFYRHCRVVFGISSSPFLLAAVLVHLLENVPADDTQLGSKLKLSFYVDNCVTGVNSIAQQEEFILRSKEILSRGCFNLRNWESNVEMAQQSMRARNYYAHPNIRDHSGLWCMNRCPDLVVCLKRELQCLRPQASLVLICRPNVAGMKGRVDLALSSPLIEPRPVVWKHDTLPLGPIR